MKAKTLVVLLVVTSILLIYSMICYSLLNKSIEVSTKNIISDYLAKSSITYQLLKVYPSVPDYISTL